MRRSEIARRLVARLATSGSEDRFTLREAGRSETFGATPSSSSGSQSGPASSPASGPVVDVLDPRVYEAVLRGGSAALGETYAQGWWDTDDLTAVLRTLFRRTERSLEWRDAISNRTAAAHRAAAALRRPDQQADRANIRAHYDLSNEFFEVMLDPTMAYSCGIFASEATSLHEASIAKFERVCTQLDLGPADHLVEIGTGWGGFAIYAAQNYGCQVTTTTISGEQFDFAAKRIADAGLTDRISLRSDHYRELPGSYSKLVSIEMIEAVPWWQLDDYFEAVHRLLKPGGLAVIQAITMNDASYERSKRRIDFIRKYIFPGSNLPSVAAMRASATRHDLHMERLTDIGSHYPPTLRAWSRNVVDHRAAISELAPHLDRPHFQRQWQFYLCYCEAAFLERHISVVHAVWSRSGSTNAL